MKNNKIRWKICRRLLQYEYTFTSCGNIAKSKFGALDNNYFLQSANFAACFIKFEEKQSFDTQGFPIKGKGIPLSPFIMLPPKT